MPLPVRPAVLRGLLKELRSGDGDRRPLVVGGARELAAVLRRELGVAGGDAPEGAAVLVYVISRAAVGGPSARPGAGGFAAGASSLADDDEAALRRARRARVPIVAVAPVEVDTVPYVLATDVVRVPPGQGFPVEEIAKAVAARLGEDAAPLAARVPALRRAVCERLVASFARKNALVAAAVFVPGADLPLLALNQLRLVLRLEQAYGLAIDPRERAPEIAATLGAGVGLRALAHEALDLVSGPGPGAAEGGTGLPAGRRRLRRRRFQRWIVKGAVAYAGTRTLGEATLRWLETATRPPAASGRGGH